MKLKRAPSFAASSSTGARPQSPASSDEEEKIRTAGAKRLRTRARTHSNGSTASGTTCVEKEKAATMSTLPEKKQDQEKEKDNLKEKTKLVAKKTKRTKVPDAPAKASDGRSPGNTG